MTEEKDYKNKKQSLSGDAAQSGQENLTLLVSTNDRVQEMMIAGLLEDAQIPFLTRENGSGGYMKIYMGFSVFGSEIYVSQQDYERAKELLDSCLPELDVTEVGEGSPAAPDEQAQNVEIVRKRQLFRLLVILAVVGVIAVFIVRLNH